MADQVIQYTEEMVGAGHPTKSDTLNRALLVGHNADGTHKTSLIQVQRTLVNSSVSGSTQIPADNTIPQNTEGFELATVSITPKSASNKLLIICQANCTQYPAAPAIIALFQDSTAGALAVVHSLASLLTLIHVMDAGTTSPTTFKLRGGANNAGTVYFGGQYNASGAAIFGGKDNGISITVMEYAQ